MITKVIIVFDDNDLNIPNPEMAEYNFKESLWYLPKPIDIDTLKVISEISKNIEFYNYVKREK